MSIYNYKLEYPGADKKFGTGWTPTIPDLRDYTEENPKIHEVLKAMGLGAGNIKLGQKADITEWFSPVQDQGSIGSCTAHAAVGIVEYYENRSFGKYVEGSRLFVYKVTRNLLQVKGDTGADIRTTMKALALCGVAPEKYWPYTVNEKSVLGNIRTFDDEPPPFVYSAARNYEALRYFRHDLPGQGSTGMKLLNSVKKYILLGIPVMFGFYVFPSYIDSFESGEIPYPAANEEAIGAHAVVAAGYDDSKLIINTENNIKSTGALLIRNSWGIEWGDEGYGWLPYDYILNNIASDFWSLTSMKWIESSGFDC